MNTIRIGNRIVGPGRPAYIIAEMSANHNQSFDGALQLIREARRIGADAIKIQTYTADTITLDSDGPDFQVSGDSLWAGRTLYDLYHEAHTPWEWHADLQKVALEEKLDFFSSPFDNTAVDMLAQLRVPVLKIASPEIIDIPLIRYAAKTKIPLLISTGMASLDEIQRALRAATEAGAEQIALLKCTSLYPAPPSTMNVASIPHLQQIFNRPVGLSDHSLGSGAAVAAVALGACIVEKHLVIERKAGGADSQFSTEPHEFADMIQAIRQAEQALGSAAYTLTSAELANRRYRRSLFVVKDIAAGEMITEENVRSIRPGTGLAPEFLDLVIGRGARMNLHRGQPLLWEHVGGDVFK